MNAGCSTRLELMLEILAEQSCIETLSVSPDQPLAHIHRNAWNHSQGGRCKLLERLRFPVRTCKADERHKGPLTYPEQIPKARRTPLLHNNACFKWSSP